MTLYADAYTLDDMFGASKNWLLLLLFLWDLVLFLPDKVALTCQRIQALRFKPTVDVKPVCDGAQSEHSECESEESDSGECDSSKCDCDSEGDDEELSDNEDDTCSEESDMMVTQWEWHDVAENLIEEPDHPLLQMLMFKCMFVQGAKQLEYKNVRFTRCQSVTVERLDTSEPVHMEVVEETVKPEFELLTSAPSEE